ncbi:hypothetical protein [uncultured Bradyrhizobium sp.]|jgi:hypothetical protein|uniref:hypothetical protein n=1 Tax=uncultured Bradyrhizobium sp. TaxID=199684 RepID=UPI00261374EB|nr:hypothetical protein [uncultured Bradyrhizobium sp.]
MDDDVWERQALGLIKTFLGITDARKRQRILTLAEQLASGATSDTAEPGVPEASTVEERGDTPGRVE